MMTALFSLILAGYAALPFYFFRKINAAFKPPGLVRSLLGLFLMLMAVAPFMARYLDHDGHASIARVINLPVFIWIAWLFWFMAAGLLLDLWNLVVHLLGRTRPSCAKLQIRPRDQVQWLLIAIMLATAWSLIEAARPRIREVAIHHPALPADTPIRMVQVSDVHLGMLRSQSWNTTICKRIEALKPDLLVCTGDLVDTSMKNIGHQADPWAALKPPLGKFAVLGNHEYYLGLADSLAFHNKAGLQLLRGETVQLAESLQLSGVDDKDGERLGMACFRDESKLDPTPDSSRFSILLKHQPTVLAESRKRFNLQISGHTHGGQLFPFQGFVMFFYPNWVGLYRLSDSFQLYVSRGTGTWGPPLRLFAPPEITVFTLTR